MNAHRWEMEEPGTPLKLVEFEPDSPEPSEVLVEIAGCGVCHTDLGFYYDGVRTKHPLPLTLGHEMSGRVIETGSDAGEWRDRTVIVPAVIPCGTCDLCVRGRGTICRKQKSPGIDMHGGFGTHITVPSAGLCEIDTARLADIGMELADAAVIADALTTPYQAVVQAEIEPGDLAVVIGVGGVGGYAVQIAAAKGATVVAIDIDQAKLDQLGDHGASMTINATEIQGRDVRDAIRAFAKENDLWVVEDAA